MLEVKSDPKLPNADFHKLENTNLRLNRRGLVIAGKYWFGFYFGLRIYLVFKE